jgi:hypothetical protein
LGFAATYLVLETGWHFTTCNGHLKGAQPCLYAQINGMIVKIYRCFFELSFIGSLW